MKIKELSIIFPIYNEEPRLQRNLYKITNLFNSLKLINLEILLVNDGSVDNTHILINKYLKNLKKKIKDRIKYVYYTKNKGKGYALLQGVKKASKKWILTCDIDFSANPIEIKKWVKLDYIKSQKYCYFGSRKLKTSKIIYKYYRKFLGNIFNQTINLLFNLNIQDTQCGFKLYHKSYGKKIFLNLKEYGYSHDVEIAVLLKKNSITTIELPIKWAHRDKSRVNIFYDGIRMIIQLLSIKLRY